ncbi:MULTISPECIES: efflux RND transporter periplasmic adaptor subunit [unclassified Sphingomonas]|uniref:efflux RND transporter periplasmic adaptor subunit n=1 Tax=unclassified Sphingomonas TaxID=196159 RepID=UPI001D0F68B5|nr:MULTISPECIES: efflux RND transporter periplasmic adaptor subunit [unclassified Sphingomonas]MCC2980572.1 efflux RND transporter periplasmic adaptor subunit [Sphingomonas sp. IC4-52]MCD2316320.1 efflux RND transporter periplasmic adaptor subunit [Sphingomonas sp. IC-11]
MNYQTGGLSGETVLIEAPDDPVARRRRRILVIALVAAVVIALGAFFFTRGGEKPAAASAASDQAPRVTVVVPGSGAVARTINANGTLAARREMPVGVAGEGGMVTRVLVEPGQWVQAGQVLALVDRSVQTQTAQSLAAQVNVAQADLTLAQAELQRAQQLVDRGFISQADVQRRIATRDAAAARLKVAAASAAEQRARNQRLDIRAPAAGLVLTRQVEPGQIISSASGTLFRMAKGGELEMRAQLPEDDLAALPVGARAMVTPVGSDRSFEGQVWQVSPVIDPQTRQGIARIALRYDPALRPGGFASAVIVGGDASMPGLPQSAILSDEKGNFVYVVDKDNVVRRRDVRLGTVSDNSVAIASGLDGSERVVVSAGAFLNPGQKIAPVLGKPGE